MRWRALGAVPERRAASEASRTARGPAQIHVRGMSGGDRREPPRIGWGGVWTAEAVAVLCGVVAVLCRAVAVLCRAVRSGGLGSRGVNGLVIFISHPLSKPPVTTEVYNGSYRVYKGDYRDL